MSSHSKVPAREWMRRSSRHGRFGQVASAVSMAALGLAIGMPTAAQASVTDPVGWTLPADAAPAASPDAAAPVVTPPVVAPQVALLADPGPVLSAKAPLDRWTLAQADTGSAPIPAPGPDASYGPPPAETAPPAAPDRNRYRSFLGRVGAVKWEVAVGIAFLTATNLSKVVKNGGGFEFEDEGWFGDGTANLGVDKTAHAFNDALISDILYQRMIRKTGEGRGPAATAALLGLGLQLYGEVYDGFDRPGGWSWQDVTFDAIGSAFSYLRNSVPGLRDKLDFRILITPNHDFYTPTGKAHFEQQRFLLAMKLSGFERFKHTPLRFVELHAGYYATGFTTPQRQRGEPLVQRPFIGIGFNLQELFFPHPTGWLSKAGRTVLEYLQLPYTAASIDTHGRVSY